MTGPSSFRIVRVYLHEGEHQVDAILELLHDRLQVRGATVFRGVAGFGPTGHMHTADLVDLGMDLPLVVEFYETEDRARSAIRELGDIVDADHVVSWPVETGGMPTGDDKEGED